MNTWTSEPNAEQRTTSNAVPELTGEASDMEINSKGNQQRFWTSENQWRMDMDAIHE
jgi:hypothetical protein